MTLKFDGLLLSDWYSSAIPKSAVPRKYLMMYQQQIILFSTSLCKGTAAVQLTTLHDILLINKYILKDNVRLLRYCTQDRERVA